MAVGWITHFYINASTPLLMKCVDSSHLGEITPISGGGEHFKFDDQNWHTMNSGTSWSCSWCGIPWFSNAPPLGHYREIATAPGVPSTVMFYQSEMENNNYIVLQNVQTGRPIARIGVPKDDYNVNFRWEDDGPYIDVVNDASSTTELLTDIDNQAQKWVSAAGGTVAAAIKAAAS